MILLKTPKHVDLTNNRTFSFVASKNIANRSQTALSFTPFWPIDLYLIASPIKLSVITQAGIMDVITWSFYLLDTEYILNVKGNLLLNLQYQSAEDFRSNSETLDTYI